MFGLHFDAQPHVLTFAPHVSRMDAICGAAGNGRQRRRRFRVFEDDGFDPLNATRHGAAELRLEFLQR